MAEWVKRIEATESIWEMDELIEEMAYDENITNDEYCQLYGMALDKMR